MSETGTAAWHRIATLRSARAFIHSVRALRWMICEGEEKKIIKEKKNKGPATSVPPGRTAHTSFPGTESSSPSARLVARPAAEGPRSGRVPTCLPAACCVHAARVAADQRRACMQGCCLHGCEASDLLARGSGRSFASAARGGCGPWGVSRTPLAHTPVLLLPPPCQGTQPTPPSGR